MAEMICWVVDLLNAVQKVWRRKWRQAVLFYCTVTVLYCTVLANQTQNRSKQSNVNLSYSKQPIDLYHLPILLNIEPYPQKHPKYHPTNLSQVAMTISTSDIKPTTLTPAKHSRKPPASKHLHPPSSPAAHPPYTSTLNTKIKLGVPSTNPLSHQQSSHFFSSLKFQIQVQVQLQSSIPNLPYFRSLYSFHCRNR